MKVLVTGCAGFVGSTLADALLAQGHHVVGVDAFTPYYDEKRKRSHLESALTSSQFELVEADLRSADLATLLSGVDVVFHQAGQPGVRLSWSDGFADYDSLNILATQRLLEASQQADLKRFVYASSSSVYGNAARYPTAEDDVPQPHSPYGVTKLAAEHLCSLYAANWGLPTVSLRYFTVYGPRQRPDMAMHGLMRASVTGEPFPLFGTGRQVRDFTFVDDVVAANIAAATADIRPGSVFNIAGGGSVTMNEVFEEIEEISGRPLNLERRPDQPGDVARTGGSIDKAKAQLGWKPEVSLREGLAAHLKWMESELQR